MQAAIEIRNLGKQYKLAASEPYIALRDIISGTVKNMFRHRQQQDDKFWALRDINLDIQPGERVGIIGRNGAGKSTLLKIISRIIPPTTGEATIRGRVGSLLEVGTGFHPELTGRENIYLNGSILGLKKADINRQLDAIIDFSGVIKFIDTPLKHYSSGMQMRLAFAVASHLESEILLIDEVLAVGDHEFQKKCIGKMEEVSKQEGRTIVFVSHNLAAVSTLTSKCLFLNNGLATAFTSTAEAIGLYTSQLLYSSAFEADPLPDSPSITGVNIITSEGGSLQKHGAPMDLGFKLHVPEANQLHLALSFQIINNQDQAVTFNWLFDHEQAFGRKKGFQEIGFTFPDLQLYKGKYRLKVFLANSKTRERYQEIDCCPFEVDMIGIPEPDWGWNEGNCQYLEKGNWKI